jgi:hypothetical protein
VEEDALFCQMIFHEDSPDPPGQSYFIFLKKSEFHNGFSERLGTRPNVARGLTRHNPHKS